jgi:hypothetical protein
MKATIPSSIYEQNLVTHVDEIDPNGRNGGLKRERDKKQLKHLLEEETKTLSS